MSAFSQGQDQPERPRNPLLVFKSTSAKSYTNLPVGNLTSDEINKQLLEYSYTELSDAIRLFREKRIATFKRQSGFQSKDDLERLQVMEETAGAQERRNLAENWLKDVSTSKTNRMVITQGCCGKDVSYANFAATAGRSARSRAAKNRVHFVSIHGKKHPKVQNPKTHKYTQKPSSGFLAHYFGTAAEADPMGTETKEGMEEEEEEEEDEQPEMEEGKEEVEEEQPETEQMEEGEEEEEEEEEKEPMGMSTGIKTADGTEVEVKVKVGDWTFDYGTNELTATHPDKKEVKVEYKTTAEVHFDPEARQSLIVSDAEGIQVCVDRKPKVGLWGARLIGDWNFAQNTITWEHSETQFMTVSTLTGKKFLWDGKEITSKVKLTFSDKLWVVLSPLGIESFDEKWNYKLLEYQDKPTVKSVEEAVERSSEPTGFWVGSPGHQHHISHQAYYARYGHHGSKHGHRAHHR